MKPSLLFILLGVVPAGAQTASYVNFVRQTQQATQVVWDMPVAPTGASPAALLLENGGALFQLWTIDQTANKDYLLDQKLVDAYLPTADITISTLDPYASIRRTRVDQPFTVEINVAGLLTGLDLPPASSSVLLEKHLGSYQPGVNSVNLTEVLSNTPASSAYLTTNGKTFLRFEASSLTASDPTKASGEEHFVVHALSDGTATQTQIASASVQVWPVASGAIKGVTSGDKLRFQMPQIELLLNDLYPRSNTYLMLYEGTQIAGVEGTLINAYPVDRETTVSTVIQVTGLDSKIGKDGTYTLALMSDTVYGRELLCAPVSFSVNRTLHVNAMQVNFSDGNTP